MIRRFITCLALGVLWLPGACSSTSTNETPASGGGGGAGPTCADAGLSCIDCCKAIHGELALGAFVDVVKTCSCTDIQEGCVLKCKPVCTDNGVADPCMLCIRDGQLAQCLNENCSGASCSTFRTCVQNCGG